MKLPKNQTDMGMKSHPENVFKNFVYRFFSIGLSSVKEISMHNNDAKIDKSFCKDTMDNPWLP